MALPLELRQKIYHDIVLTWDPIVPHPRSDQWVHEPLYFARRNKTPMMAYIQEVSRFNVEHISSKEVKQVMGVAYEATNWYGLLDFFKPSEYSNLGSFFWALEKFEGRRALPDPSTGEPYKLDDPRKANDRSLGVLATS